MSFSEQASKLLEEAGWKEGRSANPKNMERLLREKGFAVLPAQSRFLSQFGGLTFRNPTAEPPAAEDWHFRVMDALGHVTPEDVASYARLLGVPLSVIGYGFGDYLLLMMDEAGRVYGGYDNIFLHVGDSGEDAIEALATGRKLLPVEKKPVG